jgi:hypothetical protein
MCRCGRQLEIFDTGSTDMKKAFIKLVTRATVAATIIGIQPQLAGADVALPKQGWVVVTRPVLACSDGSDVPELRQKLFDAFAHPHEDGSLPKGCALLKVGNIYLLDDEQTKAENHTAIKMWVRNCTKGCSPWMSPVYAPARQLVGAYLRPTKAPKE